MKVFAELFSKSDIKNNCVFFLPRFFFCAYGVKRKSGKGLAEAFGENPRRGFSLFSALPKIHPLLRFSNDVGNFALCGGRGGFALHPSTFLKKSGAKNFDKKVCLQKLFAKLFLEKAESRPRKDIYMKAFIYTGGGIEPSRITEKPKAGDLIIAADSGYHNAQALGVQPTVLLGDMDSIGSREGLPDTVELLKVPAEKDFTDTQMAVDVAIERGAEEIIIIGGLDGRLDHALSNLSILEDLWHRHIHAHITDGRNRVRYIESTSTLVARSAYRYLSLRPVSEKVKGVSIEGCRYPLKNEHLTRAFAYAVSNEITGNCALISVKKGAMLIVESADA